MKTVRPYHLLSAILVLAVSFGTQADESTPIALTHPHDFVLKVEGQRLSLKATDAPLKAILERIGREMGIEMVAYIPEDERITVEFEGLPLREALERLNTSYAYQLDATDEGGARTRLFVVPKEQGVMASKLVRTAPQAPQAEPSSEESLQPEPFKFQFDPLQVKSQPD